MAKTSAGRPKKRNPQDLTLRNLRALKKRLALLEDQIGDLSTTVQAMQRSLGELKTQIAADRVSPYPPPAEPNAHTV